MGHIDWIPIAEMPDALKDGREVLLWGDTGANVASWRYGGWDNGFASEIDGSPFMVESVIHFAEINPPAEG